MSKPIVVSIPHQLGKEEALRRLQSGLGRFRTSFGDKVAVVEETWAGDHLDFRWGIFGQTVGGNLDVAADHVRLEVQLPWLLAQLAEKATALIQKQGTLLLGKK
jgi:hypothetical protein